MVEQVKIELDPHSRYNVVAIEDDIISANLGLVKVRVHLTRKDSGPLTAVSVPFNEGRSICEAPSHGYGRGQLISRNLLPEDLEPFGLPRLGAQGVFGRARALLFTRLTFRLSTSEGIGYVART